jgi:hypothetical protein
LSILNGQKAQRDQPRRLKFSAAIEEGLRLAVYEPGMPHHYRYTSRPGTMDMTLYADAAGLACLGARLVLPHEAQKYLPTPLWDAAIKARCWRAWPALGRAWRKGDDKNLAWDTLGKLCKRDNIALRQVVAWVRVLGG